MSDSEWIWSAEHGDYYKAVYGPDGRVVRYVWGRATMTMESQEPTPVERRETISAGPTHAGLHEKAEGNGTGSHSTFSGGSSYSGYYDTQPRASTSSYILPTAANAPQAPPQHYGRARNDEGKGIAGCPLSPTYQQSSGHSVSAGSAQASYSQPYAAQRPPGTNQYQNASSSPYGPATYTQYGYGSAANYDASSSGQSGRSPSGSAGAPGEGQYQYPPAGQFQPRSYR